MKLSSHSCKLCGMADGIVIVGAAALLFAAVVLIVDIFSLRERRPSPNVGHNTHARQHFDKWHCSILPK